MINKCLFVIAAGLSARAADVYRSVEEVEVALMKWMEKNSYSNQIFESQHLLKGHL